MNHQWNLKYYSGPYLILKNCVNYNKYLYSYLHRINSNSKRAVIPSHLVLVGFVDGLSVVCGTNTNNAQHDHEEQEADADHHDDGDSVGAPGSDQGPVLVQQGRLVLVRRLDRGLHLNRVTVDCCVSYRFFWLGVNYG